MQTVTIDLPKMYGDHHVSEVRRLLLALPGVEDVYASSAFHVVRVRIDETTVTEADLRTRLDNAGYLGELAVEVEAWKSGTPKETEDNPFRHTVALEGVKTVTFGQQVEEAGRPLWPCPGMGPLQKMDE